MKLLFQSIRLWAITLVIFGILYPTTIWLIAKVLPGNGLGAVDTLIGQSFSSGTYFWGRPSAVGYNAAGTGGSNQGPTNPAHLEAVQSRLDTILHYHPYLTKQQVPSAWLTASGSGLDPNITVEIATLQAKRISQNRGLPEQAVLNLITSQTEKHILGPELTINVLALNKALDAIKPNKISK